MIADLLTIAAKLYQYGYFNRVPAVQDADGKPDWRKVVQAGKDTIAAAMDAYAKFNGLPPQARQAGTALVASDTFYKALTSPRCGVPDMIQDGEEARAKWQFLDVSYWDGIEIPGVKPEAIAAAYDQSFRQWAEVSALAPVRVLDQNRANVWAHARRIDRAGSVLAWSYIPIGSRGESLEQVYDTADAGSYANHQFLVAVACHEIGHALGLPHGPGGKCLMSPYVNAATYKPQSTYDIPEIVARYGPRPAGEPIPPTTPPPPFDPKPPSFEGSGIF